MRRLASLVVLVPAFALACSTEAPTVAAPNAASAARAAQHATAEHHGLPTLTATLTGHNEVTAAGAPNAGDPDGFGTARVTVDVALHQVCYEINVGHIALPATGSHIHSAPAGKNGPIVVNFVPVDANGVTRGCTSVARELASAIVANPADYYANVHNPEYPGGAIRGQLAY